MQFLRQRSVQHIYLIQSHVESTAVKFFFTLYSYAKISKGKFVQTEYFSPVVLNSTVYVLCV